MHLCTCICVLKWGPHCGCLTRMHLAWGRLANFLLLTFWLYTPLYLSTQLICGTYPQKSPSLPAILSFYIHHLPFLPLLDMRLWVSCLLECDSYFTVMKATCASNFSCSWYPDVGFGEKQRWAPSFPVSHR